MHGVAALLEAIAGIHIDIPDNIATRQDIQTATEAILVAIRNIDLSSVAKQGSNPNATNTAILSACDPNIASDEDVDAFLDTVLTDYQE